VSQAGAVYYGHRAVVEDALLGSIHAAAGHLPALWLESSSPVMHSALAAGFAARKNAGATPVFHWVASRWSDEVRETY